jgi:enediyne biosynthesis protein E4
MIAVPSCRDAVPDTVRPARGPIWFEDGTGAAGVDWVHRSGDSRKRYLVETIGAGAVIADLNGDEHLDLFLVNGGDVDRSDAPALLCGLFFGDGKGGLRRAPESDATRNPYFGFGAAAADYDKDGDLDIVVCCLGPIVLLRNRGDGTFEDVTAAAGLKASGWWSSACFGDVDGDGWLDLFVAAYFEFGPAARSRTKCEWAGIRVACGPKGETPLPDVLYRNKGNGTFEDVSERSGILADSPRFGLAVTMADLDEDHDLDILVANDSMPNNFWENDGKGSFTDTALNKGLALSAEGHAQAGMGLGVEDFDGDGRLDVLLTTFSRDYNTLFLQGADATFEDRTAVAGLAQPTWRELAFGVLAEDFDSDGEIDAFFANGHVYPEVDRFQVDTSYAQKCQVFRNLGKARFEDLAGKSGPGLEALGVSRGAASGDLDEDGRIDVVVSNLDAAPYLLWNRSASRNHWLEVRLRAARGVSDLTCVGAVVTVRSGDRAWKRESRAGTSFASSNSPDLHFGLGSRTAVESVDVRFPDGTVVTRRDVPIDRVLVIERRSESR